MTIQQQQRVSAGTPTGGQFATGARREPTLTLSPGRHAAPMTTPPPVLLVIDRPGYGVERVDISDDYRYLASGERAESGDENGLRARELYDDYCRRNAIEVDESAYVQVEASAYEEHVASNGGGQATIEAQEAVVARAGALTRGEVDALAGEFTAASGLAATRSNDIRQALLSHHDQHFDEVRAEAIDRRERAYEQVAARGGASGWTAARAVEDAMTALAFRDLVDRPDLGEGAAGGGAWTQESYDHLTRAYRLAVGPVHPDDGDLPRT